MPVVQQKGKTFITPEKGTSSNPYVINKDTKAKDRNIITRYLPSDGGKRIVERNGKIETIQLVELKQESTKTLRQNTLTPSKITVVSGQPKIRGEQAQQLAQLTKEKGRININTDFTKPFKDPNRITVSYYEKVSLPQQIVPQNRIIPGSEQTDFSTAFTPGKESGTKIIYPELNYKQDLFQNTLLSVPKETNRQKIWGSLGLSNKQLAEEQQQSRLLGKNESWGKVTSTTLKSIKSGFVDTGVGFGTMLIVEPIKFGAGLFTGKTYKDVYSFATSSEVRGASLLALSTTIEERPGLFVGGTAGMLVAPKFYGKVAEVGKNVYVSSPTKSIKMGFLDKEFNLPKVWKAGYLGRFRDPTIMPEFGPSGNLLGGKDVFINKQFYIQPQKVFAPENIVSPGYTRSGSLKESIVDFRSTEVRQVVSPYEKVIISEISSGGKLPSGTRVVSQDLAGRRIKISRYERYYGPVVQTSSPQSLGSGIVGAGKKASLGLEDPGIYVNPKGMGSTGPFGSSGSSSSVNLDFVSPLKGYFNVPTVSEFRTRGLGLYPEDVLGIPGFEGLGVYQKSISGTGKILITKRSMIAFGDVKPQSYFNKPLGKKMLETGSGEKEAIIPLDTKFGIKTDQFRFTVFDGRAIRIRPNGKLFLSGKKLSGGFREISGETLKSEQKGFSGDVSSPLSGGSVYRGFKPLNLGVSSSVKSSGESNILSSNISRGDVSSSLVSDVSRVSSNISRSGVSNISGVSSISGSSIVSRSGISSISSISGFSGGSFSGISGFSGRSGISKISGISRVPSSSIPPIYSALYDSSKSKISMYKKKKSKSKQSKIRISEPGLYILPDLRSVSLTEGKLFGKYQGGSIRGEAVAPKATLSIKYLSNQAFKGGSFGYVPTEQIRTGKVKI
jgi:hypothetical protein